MYMNLSSIPSIDFYVSVIDNYGDMGFAVNLALSLQEKYPNMSIRFFSDDENLFQKFFRGNTPEWIEYLSLDTVDKESPPAPAKLICNLFDRPLPKIYLAKFPYEKTIVSFSYFLLHSGLESLHKTMYVLESGYDTVIHFIPSLLPLGGGIIINPIIEERRRELLWDGLIPGRKRFLREMNGANFPIHSENQDICEKKWISIFVYRETLEKILPIIESDISNTVFWICGDTQWMGESPSYRIFPFLSLEDYGVFQSLCDANIVRWENSLCQSLLSGRPALWDIYKESNGAHLEKIEDYLSFLGEQFPETHWEEYNDMMRHFNDSKEREWAFLDFISWYTEYEEIFKKISEYVRGECDLVRKLEEILK